MQQRSSHEILGRPSGHVAYPAHMAYPVSNGYCACWGAAKSEVLAVTAWRVCMPIFGLDLGLCVF